MPEVRQLDQYLFTLSEFLSKDECDHLIAETESIGYSPAEVNSPGGGSSIAPNIRNNMRVIMDDAARADDLWHRLLPHCPGYYQAHAAVGLNERFRFYRYDKGQVFRWHTDGCYRRESGETSRLTFMVYLNSDFDGGETNFEGLSIDPMTGMGLLFAHGYLHEGGEVFGGRKYVLRTDVMYSALPCDID